MAFDFVTAGIQLFDDALKAFIPDATERLKQATAMAAQANALLQGQIELNKIEAASPSWFNSGWRPATGWICVGGLGYQVMLRPIVQSVVSIWLPEYKMVPLEIDTLLTLLFGMLGLGAYRTYEKVQGATK